MSLPDYRPLSESWPVPGRLVVSFKPFLDLEVKIPVDFVVRSGQPSLAFVQYLAQQLVNESDGDVLTHVRGPEGKYPGQIAGWVAEDSDEASDESTAHSTDRREWSFRHDVMMRDGGDLFANLSGKKCIAAHLVPKTRPDVYKKLLDATFLYDVSFGLAMERTLHQAYVELNWSIFCTDDRFIFHALDGSDPDLVRLHGSSFAVSDLRHLEPPNKLLCQWHYRQAVLKHVRAFAVA